MKDRMRGRGAASWIVAGGIVAAAVLAATLDRSTMAWPRWTDGCNTCHGDFEDGVSPQGSLFPGGDKHDMHRNSGAMDTDCDSCHVNIGDNPLLNESAGGGPGCVGCHGRDYGGAIGNSGVGLRLHHVNNGMSCSPCHDGDPAPLPENVLPFWYGTVTTNADDPCNTTGLENWTLNNPFGLDNDGDNLYDADDPDCADCPEDLNGNGQVDFADILAVIAVWGPCPGCPEDLNGNGDADFADILAIIAAWGPC
ncbi:MAG: hypothetical protein GY715_02250 [Planctomycetes bacterium]|nr:hypothetical protein [Planctomycetota bacterium]